MKRSEPVSNPIVVHKHERKSQTIPSKQQSSVVLSKGNRKDDPTVILSSLTENLQLAPAIKTIYDRGWINSFHSYLERSIVAKDEEIRQTCYEHYDELISTIDYVLAAKQQAATLKAEVSKLNQNVQDTSRHLLSHIETLHESRVVHQNILLTLHTLRRISNLFFILSQAFTQIEQRRFLIALKSLSYVQSQLPQFEHFDFVKQLELQIPSLASFIQEVVKLELEGWLSSLRAKVPTLGKFTLFTVKHKVDTSNSAVRQKILQRLQAIGLYTNNFTLGDKVSTTHATASSHFSKMAGGSTLSPPSTSSIMSSTSPSSTHQHLNVYTVADLSLGMSNDCFTIQTKSNPSSFPSKTRTGGRQATSRRSARGLDNIMETTNTTNSKQDKSDSDDDSDHFDSIDQGLKKYTSKYGITTTSSTSSSSSSKSSSLDRDRSSTHSARRYPISNQYGKPFPDDDSDDDNNDDDVYDIDTTIDNDVFSDLNQEGITSAHVKHAQKMINTSVSFIPLHQCLHVYRTLGQLGLFRQIYTERRYAQATSSIDILTASSTPTSPPSTAISPSTRQSQSQSQSPTYLSYLTTDSSESTQVDSISQLNHLFSEVIGFFIVEDAVIRSDARLLTRTELDAIWERSSLRIERVLNEYLHRLSSASQFLSVKHAIMIFLGAMDSYRFNTIGLTEFIMTKLQRFKQLLHHSYKKEAEKILQMDTYEALTIYSLEDYRNLVLYTGLADNVVKNFPVTMPFSFSVPLLCQLTRSFATYLFEFTMGLSSYAAMTTTITTFISNIIREFIIGSINKYRDNIKHVSISLCVQLRVNTTYYLTFLESLLKYCQCYIDSLFSDQVELLMFSAFDDLFELQQLLDDSIIEILKTKIDMFSNFRHVYDWEASIIQTQCSDYCLDISTFLHTTLSCMVFLPSPTRLILSLQCFDYIVQSIILALTNYVPWYTQIALHNLLLDIIEFERLAKQLTLDLSSPSSPISPMQSPLQSPSPVPSPASSSTVGAPSSSSSSTSQQTAGTVSTLTQAVQRATGTLTTSSSIEDTFKITANNLTKSFAKIKQICQLFTSDLEQYIDPKQRDEHYYLLDGLLVQGIAKKLKVPVTTPKSFPREIKLITKGELDLFQTKVKRLFDAKQL